MQESLEVPKPIITMGIIKTKEDLKTYIKEDYNRYSVKPNIKTLLLGNYNNYRIAKYLRTLRRLEFLYNNLKNPFYKFLYVIYKHYFYRLQWRYHIFIEPNVVGKGFSIVHLGYIWIDQSAIIGDYCTILPRVLIGKKKPGVPQPCIFIGDYCYIGTGVTILGPVKIGDNVTIGANSVVTHDIPDNAVVAGNPARIIKMKS